MRSRWGRAGSVLIESAMVIALVVPLLLAIAEAAQAAYLSQQVLQTLGAAQTWLGNRSVQSPVTDEGLAARLAALSSAETHLSSVRLYGCVSSATIGEERQTCPDAAVYVRLEARRAYEPLLQWGNWGRPTAIERSVLVRVE